MLAKQSLSVIDKCDVFFDSFTDLNLALAFFAWNTLIIPLLFAEITPYKNNI